MNRGNTRTGHVGRAGQAGRAGVEAHRHGGETDSLFENDEAQQRRELRLLRLLSRRWTQLSLASPQLVAYMAVNVACPFFPAELIAATRRLAPNLLEGAQQRCRTAWWREVAQADPLLCLRIALATRLRVGTEPGGQASGARDASRLFERLRAESMVDAWTALDRPGARVAVELADAMLGDVAPGPLSDTLRRLVPVLRTGALRSGPRRRREWLEPVARFEPFLAIKIGVEAVLRQDIENDLSEWTVPILSAIPARRRPARRRRPCVAAA